MPAPGVRELPSEHLPGGAQVVELAVLEVGARVAGEAFGVAGEGQRRDVRGDGPAEEVLVDEIGLVGEREHARRLGQAEGRAAKEREASFPSTSFSSSFAWGEEKRV